MTWLHLKMYLFALFLSDFIHRFIIKVETFPLLFKLATIKSLSRPGVYGFKSDVNLDIYVRNVLHRLQCGYVFAVELFST